MNVATALRKPGRPKQFGHRIQTKTRVSPEIHQAAKKKAKEEGTTLTQVLASFLETVAIHGPTKVLSQLSSLHFASRNMPKNSLRTTLLASKESSRDRALPRLVSKNLSIDDTDSPSCFSVQKEVSISIPDIEEKKPIEDFCQTPLVEIDSPVQLRKKTSHLCKIEVQNTPPVPMPSPHENTIDDCPDVTQQMELPGSWLDQMKARHHKREECVETEEPVLELESKEELKTLPAALPNCEVCQNRRAKIDVRAGFAFATRCPTCETQCQRCDGSGVIGFEEYGYHKIKHCECFGISQKLKVFNKALIPGSYAKLLFGKLPKPPSVLSDTQDLAWSMMEAFTKVYSRDPEKTRMQEKGYGVLLTGDKGTGKTLMALRTLAKLSIEQGILGRYMDVHSYFSLLKRSFRPDFDGDRPVPPEELIQLDLLVMDEIGRGKVTDWTREAISEIVHGRYDAGRPTIWISNLSGNSIENAFLGPSWDRIRATCYHLDLKGDSLRTPPPRHDGNLFFLRRPE